MGDNRNMGISVKAIAGRVQHGHREIDGRGFGFGVLAPDQAKRAAFTGAQVKDSARCARNEVEQRRFALAPVGNGVGALPMVARVPVRSPGLTGLLAVMREKYRETYRLNLNEYS